MSTSTPFTSFDFAVLVTSFAAALGSTACGSDVGASDNTRNSSTGAGTGGKGSDSGGSSGGSSSAGTGAAGGSTNAAEGTGGSSNGYGAAPDSGASTGGSNGYGGQGGTAGSVGTPDSGGGDACISEVLTTPTGIPSNLIPPNAVMVHFLHAKGTQTYTCLQNPVVDDAGPRTYDWGTSLHNATPEALVYDNCGVAKIHHFAGPTWEWIKDGSSVKGTKIAAVPQTGTIPWLLLKATVVTPGVLSNVTYVQRLETSGGAPPATGCDQAHEGEKVSIDYTAGYYFYASVDGGA